MNPKHKQLKFDHQLAQNIAKGLKTSTFRFFDDKNIRVGDIVLIVDKVEQDNPASWVINGEALVEQVLEKRLQDVNGSDWEGHEPYTSSAEFISTHKRYYKQDINEQTPIKIIRFIFKPYEKSVPYLHNQGPEQLPPEVKLYGDGGSRGNPGPSAGGFVVLSMEDSVLRESSKYLGITTNNQAEYHSLKGGLELCAKEGVRIVHVHMDSLLVVNQMKGIFKVKNRDLWPIHEAVKKLVTRFDQVTFTHVPRELNRLADAEVNKALDAVKPENKL
jgi:ribonuclease HI